MEKSEIVTAEAEPLRRRVIQEDVYERLLSMLTTERFEAGDRLPVEMIAQTLGVSPTPVREALFKLQSTGLVVYLPQRGFRVAPPLSNVEFNELMDTRRLLEGEAARGAAANVDEQGAQELRELDRQHTELAELIHSDGETVETLRQYLLVGAQFHRKLFEVCGNRYLRQLAENLNAQATRTRQSLLHGVHDASSASREHQLLLEAVLARDAETAEAMARAHVDKVRERAIAENSLFVEKERPQTAGSL